MNRSMADHIPTTHLGALGSDHGVVLNAMQIGVECAVAQGLQHLTMALPGEAQLYGILDKVFGATSSERAERDHRVSINGFVVHVATQRRPLQYRGPVVALWTRPDHTRALLTDARTTEFVFVPWGEEDVEAFQRIAPAAERF